MSSAPRNGSRRAEIPSSRSAGAGAQGERVARAAITVFVSLGVVLRIVTLPAIGFESDVASLVAWAERVATTGPAGFYEPGYLHSGYQPGILYVLGALGALLDGEALRLSLKALSIPADVAIVLVISAFVRRRAGPAAAVTAAALWSFGPAAIFAGPYWGQLDSVGSLGFLGAVLAAGSRRWALAGALAGAATMVKPQFGLAAIVVGAAASFELLRTGDWRAFARVSFAGLLTVIALALPFRQSPFSLLGLVREASELYRYTSLYAFNPWSVLLDFWRPDDAYVGLGAALLVAGVAASCAPLWWRRDTAMLLAAGALASAAFYFLPTRSHERYLFPAFVLLLPLAATRARLLLPYVVLQFTFFATLFFALSRYTQNGLRAPAWTEASLFSRPGQIALAIVLIGGFIYVAWLLLRGEARLSPTIEFPGTARTIVGGRAWRLPAGLGPGRLPTRRDVALALLVALAVVATRGFRLDQPRDMYFDEVYHARTAMELLAQRDPYEWTHPHLAKEIMALGILAFGGDRVEAREDGPRGATAFAVANEGARAYADGAGRIFVARRGEAPRLLTTRSRAVLGLEFEGDRLYGTDSFDLFAVALSDGSLQHELKLPGIGTGLLDRAGGRLVVAVDAESTPWTIADPQRAHYLPWARVFVTENEYRAAVPEEVAGSVHTWSFLGDRLFRSDPRFAGFYGPGGTTRLTDSPAVTTSLIIFPPLAGEGLVVRLPAVAITGKADSSDLFVADTAGVIHIVNVTTGQDTGRMSGGGPVASLAYARGPDRIYAGRADQAALDWYDAPRSDQGGNAGTYGGTVALSNDRTGALAGPVGPLALVPETQFLYALVGDPRRAERVAPEGATAQRSDLVVIETHGASPFAAIPVHGTMLGVDGTGDRLAVAGDGTVELVPTGRHAFAWRLPGVVTSAVMAFFIVLIARRLFASRLVPALAGAVVVLDGAMFAQARIGMNDVYVGAFLVAGCYFVIAAHAPRRSAAADVLIAGILFGLAAASKWAAFYAIAGLGLLSVVVTAYAWGRERPGTGGPFDLLAHRGDELGARLPARAPELVRRAVTLFGRGAPNALFLLVCFAVVPLAIYVASYARWFGGPTIPYRWDLVELTKQMYWYHSGLTAPHPAGSPWWSWPLVLKPVYWYLGSPGGSQTAVIYDAGNIVLFWGGIAASGWAVVAAIRARSVGLAVLVFAFLTQYVAWIPISRVLFFYHFFTALPFYLLILAAALAALWETGRRRAVTLYLALAAAAFVFFYPFISGQPVPADQAAAFYVLPTWQYDCQFYPAFHCDTTFRAEIPWQGVIGRVASAAGVALLGYGALLALEQRGTARVRAWAARFGPRRHATG